MHTGNTIAAHGDGRDGMEDERRRGGAVVALAMFVRCRGWTWTCRPGLGHQAYASVSQRAETTTHVLSHTCLEVGGISCPRLELCAYTDRGRRRRWTLARDDRPVTLSTNEAPGRPLGPAPGRSRLTTRNATVCVDSCLLQCYYSTSTTSLHLAATSIAGTVTTSNKLEEPSCMHVHAASCKQ